MEEDYFRAMSSMEQRLGLPDEPEEKEEPISDDKRGQILALTERLVDPELSAEARLVIAAQIRLVLLRDTTAFAVPLPAILLNSHAPPGLVATIAV